MGSHYFLNQTFYITAEEQLKKTDIYLVTFLKFIQFKHAAFEYKVFAFMTKTDSR